MRRLLTIRTNSLPIFREQCVEELQRRVLTGQSAESLRTVGSHFTAGWLNKVIQRSLTPHLPP